MLPQTLMPISSSTNPTSKAVAKQPGPEEPPVGGVD